MELKDILNVHGQSGLFKFVSQGRNSIIVEQIDENKRRTAISASTRVSSLQDIVIYTNQEDMPFYKVLLALKAYTQNNLAISHKSADDELREYFEKVLPSYDKQRVKVSDIKRIILWYNILRLQNFLEQIEFPKEENTVVEGQETTAKKSETTQPKYGNNNSFTPKPVSKSVGGQKMTIPRKAQ